MGRFDGGEEGGFSAGGGSTAEGDSGGRITVDSTTTEVL